MTERGTALNDSCQNENPPDRRLYRAIASANAKKRWDKEKQRRANAHPQPPQTEDISIKLKRRAIAQAQASKKVCRKLLERKASLEEDPWIVTETLDPKHVECAACGHKIALDKRRLYYPGLWLRHKARCGGIHQRFVRANDMVWYCFVAARVASLTSCSLSLVAV